MIVETIFSTLDQKGVPDFAPMGIVWGEESIIVRPYRSSRTYRNLLSSGYGVANLSDDVLAYVQCGLLHEILPNFPAVSVPGVVFQGTCSWLELNVASQTGSGERAEFLCRILHKGRQKDFLGFCRAGNAVIEAAILATRLDFCDPKELTEDLNHYMKIIEKTGGETEKQAIRMIHEFIRKREG